MSKLPGVRQKTLYALLNRIDSLLDLLEMSQVRLATTTADDLFKENAEGKNRLMLVKTSCLRGVAEDLRADSRYTFGREIAGHWRKSGTSRSHVA